MNIVSADCPVCHHSVAATFFDGGDQALATLGWPRSAAEARAMPRYPLDFVQCPGCSHVWNRSFRYENIPYQNNPNRMFNVGSIWQGHLATTGELVASELPETPTVVEIGCGEGHFLRGLAEHKRHQGRFIGFDPNATPETGRGVEFNARLFQPLTDVPALRPDAVVIRHVLEHLTNPAALLEELAWGATLSERTVWLFAESPCIDRVFETGRLSDFYYEHPSQFTTRSFRTLMERAGEIVELAHGYDREVIYALVKLGVETAAPRAAAQANAFADGAHTRRAAIREQIDALAASGETVAIWGGTGKAAAFIAQFNLDAERFPLVVDSDPDKVGTFVPGAGQEIRFRDCLKETVADVVIIPPQWRARDIAAEMAREGISAGRILIEHEGQLVDLNTGRHPY